MKWEGRIGEAGLFGCGCWAQSGSKGDPRTSALACSTTGIGEEIIRSMLSSTVCRALADPERSIEEATQTAVSCFQKTNSRDDHTRNAGFIALRAAWNNDKSAQSLKEQLDGDLVVFFSTESMAYGFIDHKMNPQVSHHARQLCHDSLMLSSQVYIRSKSEHEDLCTTFHPFRL